MYVCTKQLLVFCPVADIRAVAISTDAYTIAPKYGGAPPYTPSVGSGGTLRGHVHNNGSVPRGSLPGGTPTPANGGPPPSTLISSYSAGHSILANPGAISGVTTTAVPGPYASLKSAGGISPGSAPPPPAPPGVAGIMGSRNGSPLGTTGVSVVPHTNGHVLKGEMSVSHNGYRLLTIMSTPIPCHISQGFKLWSRAGVFYRTFSSQLTDSLIFTNSRLK